MINKSTVKYIQSLQHKKFRDEHGSFIAEGPKVTAELLSDHYFECEAVYCIENAAQYLHADLPGEKIHLVKDFELAKISALAAPNNIVAVFPKKNLLRLLFFPGSSRWRSMIYKIPETWAPSSERQIGLALKILFAPQPRQIAIIRKWCRARWRAWDA